MKIAIRRRVVKYKLYGGILAALVLVTATLVLTTHMRNSVSTRALSGAQVKGDSTSSRLRVTSRSHFAAVNSSRASQTQLLKTYGKLPLSFEANNGQTDSRVHFLARGSGYTLFLTSSEAVLSLQGSEGKPEGRVPKLGTIEKLHAHHSLSAAAALKMGIPDPKDNPGQLRHGETGSLAQSELPSSPEPIAGAVLRMKLVGANPTPRVGGLEQLPGKSSYFLGNDPKKWRTNVPVYAKVKYDSVYPGVDLVYYGNQGQLEYDFVVGPSANPRDIALSIQGANRLEVDSQGDLVVAMNGEVVRFHKPVVYQPENRTSEIEGQRSQIDGHYVLQGEDQVGFEIAEYDMGKPLVIDPVLKYATYLGGSGDDISGVFGLDNIATDPQGNTYLVGSTASTDFPTTAGAFQTTFGGSGDFYFSGDAFVAKLNASGTLVYSTYLGGSADEQGESIAADAAGRAYISGETFSTNFPTVNPLQASNAGGGDSFVAKLSADGNALVYSTYLGGSDWDPFPMIEIDSRGNAYLQGSTFSTDFPTTAGAFQTALASPPDTYVAKLNAAGNALLYSTYLGGTGEELCGTQIAVDHFGNAYVNGLTNSTDFPTTSGAIQTALVHGTCGDPPDTFPCHDGFLTKLNADGTALVYSTYLGGSDFDELLGTSLDPLGNAYISGLTFSADFPTKNPIQPTYAGGGDAYVAKVNAAGTALVYSSYLGASDFEVSTGTAVDRTGRAYVVGFTFSTDFPMMNPIQPAKAGGPDTDDIFVTLLNAAGNGIVYSTYLGGTGYDESGGIVLDPVGNVHIGGLTSSSDFPLVNPFQPTFGGGFSDAFVAKISGTDAPGKPVRLTGTGQADKAAAQRPTLSFSGKAGTNSAVQDWQRIILKRKAAH